MNPRQRFRLLINTGSALLEEGDLKAAGRRFLEARSEQPADAQALAYEALGYECLDDPARAYIAALEVLKVHVVVPHAAGVLIRCAQPSIGVEELERMIPPPALDGEAAVALALRALQQGQLEHARRFARDAEQLLPDSPYSNLAIGKVLLAAEIGKCAEPRDGTRRIDRDCLAEAEQRFTTAIDLSVETKHAGLRVDALVCRAQTRELLGGRDPQSDIVEAYRLSPNEMAVLVQYSTVLEAQGDKEGAIDCLRRAVALEPLGPVRMMLAVALYQTGERRRQEEALAIFESLAVEDGASYQEEAVRFVLRDRGREENPLAGERFLELVGAHATPVQMEIFRAVHAQSRGDLDEARSRAMAIAALLTDDAAASTTRSAAQLLASLGCYRDALVVWQRLLVGGLLTGDVQNLLACADRVGRHDIALDVCRGLRESGAGTRELLEHETGLLERYDPLAAIALLQAQLEKDASDRLARLKLSVIALRVGLTDLVVSSPDLLPSPLEADPEWLPYVVHVLQATGQAGTALRYAYRALRRHFDRHEAHRAYAMAMGPGVELDMVEIGPDIVGPGTSVCYREVGDDLPRWLVIEDESEVYPSLGEASLDDPSVQRFLGRRSGDVVALTDGAVQERTATIVEIQSKYTHRYQDVLSNWQLRFSREPFVQMLRFEPREGPEGETLDFGPLLRLLDDNESKAERALQIYKEHACPIHLLAKRLGHNDISTQFALAEDSDATIRCNLGVLREPHETPALHSGVALVLDVTALGTVLLLEAEDFLQMGAPVLTSYGVLDELRRYATQFENPSLSATIGKSGGRYVGQELLSEERERLHAKLTGQQSAIDRCCEKRGAPGLARVAPDVRAELVGLFGQHGAETILVAAEAGRVLWTDDVTVSVYARERFGVGSVCTEEVLRQWTDCGRISREEYSEACAKLLGWDYVASPVNADVLLAAGKLCAWNPCMFPLERAIQVVTRKDTRSRVALGILAAFLPRMFLEVALPEVREAVAVSVLDHLGSRQDNIVVVLALRRALPRAFGLDHLHADEMCRILDAWLRYRS